MLNATSSRGTDDAVLFAKVAERLSLVEVGSQDYRDVIIEKARSKGYVNEHGRPMVAKLSNLFAKRFSEGFEDIRINEWMNRCDVPTLFARGNARRERPMHPAILVLMDMFLDAISPIEAARKPLSARFCKPTSESEAFNGELDVRRACWLQHMVQNDQLSRSELRSKAKANWAWLYRHDREWLYDHQPMRRRPKTSRKRGWAVGQVERVLRIGDLNKRAQAHGLEPLPSGYQARLAMGLSDYAFAIAAEQFQMGTRVVAPGRYEVFVSRRYQAGLQMLSDMPSHPAVSVISRAARLRESTVRRYKNNGL